MKLDMHDKPTLMLTAALIVSMLMLIMTGIYESGSAWPYVFGMEMVISACMMLQREKQLEKKAKIYECEHP